MRIEFFGHSIAGKKHVGKTDTFVDIIINKYQATNRYVGVAECSEERILYELKKHQTRTPIDVAIIFHANPAFYFVPTLTRDYHKMPDDQINQAIEYNQPMFIPEIAEDRMPDIHKQYGTVDKDDFISAIRHHQKYYLNTELSRNRYYGALLQIDQYLAFKKIPVIHCVSKKEWIPNWFKFTTGIVDYEIAPMQFRDSQWACHYTQSDNAVTYEGNLIIADKLSGYIDQLVHSANI
jgi:hypothetical protein